MNFSSYNCNFSFLPVKIKKSGEYLLEDYKILKRGYPNVILLETPTFSPRHYFDKNGNRFDDNTIISVISRKENNIEFFFEDYREKYLFIYEIFEASVVYDPNTFQPIKYYFIRYFEYIDFF